MYIPAHCSVRSSVCVLVSNSNYYWTHSNTNYYWTHSNSNYYWTHSDSNYYWTHSYVYSLSGRFLDSSRIRKPTIVFLFF